MSAMQPATLTAAPVPLLEERRSVGNWTRAWQRFRGNRLALPALTVVSIFVLLALAAPLIAEYVTGYSVTDQNVRNNFAPADGEHWLGTDEYGRDVLTRLIYGGRVSLGVAALATTVAVVIGTLVGAIAAYYGGWIDGAIMRFVDVLISIPGFFILILISTLIQPGPAGLAVVIAVFGWYGLARLVRSEVLSVREREFVTAARVLGASDRRILLSHIVPNVTHLVIIFATGAVPGYIVAEAGLSYLGLGIQPPTPSWGNMLSNSTAYLYQSVGLIFFPGLVLTITVLCLTILGNALRDALDPRLTG